MKIQFLTLTIAMFFALWRFTRRNHVDLLHAQWSLPGFISVLVGKLMKIPVVVTERGAALHLAMHHWLMQPVLLYALRRSDFITTNNERQAALIQELGIDQRKIRVVANGVDQKLFKRMDKRACKRKFNLEKHHPVILFVGWLIERKGLTYLLQALQGIVKQFPTTKLVVIGQGPLGQKLREEVRARHLDAHVTFAGETSHADVAAYMNAADLFVLPSLSEGRANVLSEALACEIPVVATDVGDAASVVEDGTSGFLCKPANAGDLEKKIRLALKKRFQQRFLRSVAQVKKAKLQSWDACAQEYVGIYRKIL